MIRCLNKGILLPFWRARMWQMKIKWICDLYRDKVISKYDIQLLYGFRDEDEAPRTHLILLRHFVFFLTYNQGSELCIYYTVTMWCKVTLAFTVTIRRYWRLMWVVELSKGLVMKRLFHMRVWTNAKKSLNVVLIRLPYKLDVNLITPLLNRYHLVWN